MQAGDRFTCLLANAGQMACWGALGGWLAEPWGRCGEGGGYARATRQHADSHHLLDLPPQAPTTLRARCLAQPGPRRDACATHAVCGGAALHLDTPDQHYLMAIQGRLAWCMSSGGLWRQPDVDIVREAAGARWQSGASAGLLAGSTAGSATQQTSLRSDQRAVALWGSAHTSVHSGRATPGASLCASQQQTVSPASAEDVAGAGMRGRALCWALAALAALAR